MKKFLVILTALVFVVGFSTVSFSAILGTPHDFKAEGWNTSGEICVVCHTPHDGGSVTGAPLWNHEVSGVTTFTLYTSDTFDADDIAQPGGSSKLCLSCHDGTISIDAFGGAAGGTRFITANYQVGEGNSLVDEHPVSFSFDNDLYNADGGLFDPAVKVTSLGGTIQEDLLYSDKVECASCHNPHDNANSSFLRISNSGSALCLTCHDK